LRAAFFSTLLASLAFAQPAVQAPPERWVVVYKGGPRRPAYTVDDLTRLLATVDSSGRPVGPLCNAVIMTEFEAVSGRYYMPWASGSPATGADWSQYLDSVVITGGPLARLDSAADRLPKVGAGTVRKIPVAVMVPFPIQRPDTLHFLGHDYAMSTEAGRLSSVEAYMREVVHRLNAMTFRNLSVTAFYWLNEGVDNADTSLVLKVSRVAHLLNMRFLWIPSWGAPNATNWRGVGFDEAWQQPNYFFHPEIPATRLDSAAARARSAGMGLELEFDRRLFSDPKFGERLDPYLATFERASDLRRSIAVYEGGGALIQLSRTNDAAHRVLYDWLVSVLQSGQMP
jgi:uncharacterized protein DUF4855